MSNLNFYNVLLEFSYRIGLPVKKILDIFFYLKDGSEVENFELIRKTGIAKNTINAVKESFQEIFGKASTTTKIDATKTPDLLNFFDNNYKTDEKLLNLPIDGQDSEFLNERVKPSREFDQFTATPETVMKRATLLNHLSDIKGKKILFLGDDDFTSVAASLVAKPQEIVVLDVDDRILQKIKELSDKHNLNIKTVKHNLLKSLPQELISKFDVIFTDPPYTAEGIRLFLSRAISALDRTNLSGRIYLCYGNSDRAKERFIPIYRSIVDSGLMLRYVFDKFNRYNGAESIGSCSSLYILDTTPKVKALIKGDYGNPIYTND